LKKLTLACLLLLSSAALANPSSSHGLPPGEGGMGERDLRSLMDQRVMRLPAGNSAPLGLVPIGDEEDGAAVPAPAGASSAKLPPIMINAKVKSYQKVAVGRRRMSLSSRGAATNNDASEIIYKTVPRVEQKAVNISPIIEKYAAQYNLDPWLIRGVIETESAFRPNAVSPVGAGGLMQLMPGTASYLGCADRFDPDQNIAAGSRYLRMMMDRFGNEDLMIAAYNAGPGNVERYGGIPPFAETRNYVVKVKKAWKNAKAAHGQ
jgi:soluble lytic murein transglycosylase-like protein